MNNEPSLDKIPSLNKLYENLTYFDQYNSSLILFFILSILLFILVSYCYINIHIQAIKEDWINQRCKPYVIPFAGIINKPADKTATEYTSENFNYCTQNILSSVSGPMLEPIQYVTQSTNNVLGNMKDEINDVRAMFDKVRTFFETMTKELMGRIMNITIPLQKIIISFKDFIGKIQGTMVATLFTLFGSYFTLKSLLGAIAEFIIKILIALAAMILMFWALPFTWGLAATYTSFFIAISIPMALILAFMSNVMKVHMGLNIPKLKKPKLKCFDKNTKIVMNDGRTFKNIIDVQIGDVLLNNNIVTAKIKVETSDSKMYLLNNIIVSDSHLVKKNNKWIRVSSHPDAKLLEKYEEPYLYCLNTSDKTILLGGHTTDTPPSIFSDWDEITDLNKGISFKQIHTYLDGGFVGDTKIKLRSGEIKNIENVNVGDILERNERVYGIVEINGDDLKQYSYFNETMNGGPNLVFYNEKNIVQSTIDLEKKNIILRENSLYHLLTDKSTFHIGNIRFCDYNACVDF